MVVGILIALQVNNWNEDRLQGKLMNGYFKEMHQELKENMSLAEEYIVSDSTLVSLIERSLAIIDEGNPDSLKQLDYTLGAVGTSYTRPYTFPITEDFIGNGYINQVKEDSLKLALRRLKHAIERSNNLNQYISDQYQLKIEPFFYHYINYSRVVLDPDEDSVIVGGPDSDYRKLIGNMEAWNIINFKLEITNSSLVRQKSNLRIMKFLIKKLDEIMKE